MLTKFVKDIGRDETGASAIEYGLIAALIVIALMASLNSFAGSSITMWNMVTNTVTSVMN